MFKTYNKIIEKLWDTENYTEKSNYTEEPLQLPEKLYKRELRWNFLFNPTEICLLLLSKNVTPL